MKKVIVFLFFHTVFSVKLCKKEADYYDSSNKNCWENNADNMNVTEILRNLFGFIAEEHSVTTEDGYTLLLVRCYKNVTKKHPVIMGHGTFSNSLNFVGAMNKSLAYELVTEGYDVWLINFRGSKYSRKHEKLTVEDDSFWDFSFHEMGIYDMPAILTYVHQMTKIKALYIGTSMGTSVMLVYSSLNPNEARDRILGAVLYGPAAKFVNRNSTLSLLDPTVSVLPYIFPEYKHGAVLYNGVVEDTIMKMVVRRPFLLKMLFKNILSLADGYNPNQFDWTTLPVIVAIALDISTNKMLRHYGQCVNSGEFKQFDYGIEENIKRYNSKKAPVYPVENINIPIAMLASKGDIITPIAGAIELYNQLQDTSKCGFSIPKHLISHVGLYSCKHIKEEIHKPIMEYLKKIENGDC